MVLETWQRQIKNSLNGLVAHHFRANHKLPPQAQWNAESGLHYHIHAVLGFLGLQASGVFPVHLICEEEVRMRHVERAIEGGRTVIQDSVARALAILEAKALSVRRQLAIIDGEIGGLVSPDINAVYGEIFLWKQVQVPRCIW